MNTPRSLYFRARTQIYERDFEYPSHPSAARHTASARLFFLYGAVHGYGAMHGRAGHCPLRAVTQDTAVTRSAP